MTAPQSPETHPYSERTIREKTAELAEHEVRHLTSFDQELIAGAEDLGASLPLSNSKQIARGPGGSLYVLLESERLGLCLSRAAAPRPRSDCFQPPAVLVGLDRAGPLGRAEGPARHASLVIAEDGAAALSWDDARGVRLARGRASGDGIDWSGKAALIASGATAADLSMDAGGRPWVLLHSCDGVFVASGDGGRGSPQRLADSATGGVLSIGPMGDLHVAFQRITSETYRIGEAIGKRITDHIWYARGRGGAWSVPERVTWSVTLHPSMVLWRGEPLIVYQTEGIKKVERGAKDYLFQREGGGSGVGFAVRENGAWRIGEVARAQEMVVSEGCSRDVFEGRAYPMVDEMHRPRLGLDRHGVPWAVWTNTTRRHTYAARWLGREFSAPQELRGGWYALSESIAVEPAMPADADHLAMATVAADRVYFTPAPVPALRADSPAHVTFLDLLDVAELDGVEQALGQLQRYPGNPVLTPNASPAWDDLSVYWPAIWPEGDGYLMQYQGAGTLLPGTNMVMGLARSRDGIRWERPILGVVQIEGQPDNNCIPWVVFLRDDEEPDPAKRYKGARCNGIWTKNLVRKAVYSADAIHWVEAGEMTNMHCLHEANGPSFIDPLDVPERRFKAIGRTCCDEGRGAGMMWSADGVRWEGFEAFLDIHDPYGKPATAWRGRYNAHRYLHPCGEPRGQQIYWNTVWIEHGMYLCLYGPMRWDGGYDMALAVSRDGYRWTRVCHGDSLLPRQPIGARESGSVSVGYGNGRPVRFGDKLRVYYAAVPRHHGLDPHAHYEGSGIGFAELRLDGWACVRVRRDRREGSLTTTPIRVPEGAFDVAVNGEGIGRFDGRAALSVEVLDAESGRPLPGFSADESSVLADEGVRVPVSWRGGAVQGPRDVRLRFHLRSPWARLYSFWFEPR